MDHQACSPNRKVGAVDWRPLLLRLAEVGREFRGCIVVHPLGCALVWTISYPHDDMDMRRSTALMFKYHGPRFALA